MKFPVLLEQANSLGGWASILSFRRVEVRYAALPPNASQKSSVQSQEFSHQTQNISEIIVCLCSVLVGASHCCFN